MVNTEQLLKRIEELKISVLNAEMFARAWIPSKKDNPVMHRQFSKFINEMYNARWQINKSEGKK